MILDYDHQVETVNNHISTDSYVYGLKSDGTVLYAAYKDGTYEGSLKAVLDRAEGQDWYISTAALKALLGTPEQNR